MTTDTATRETAASVWGVTAGRVRRDSTAHLFRPQADGWISECGRYLPDRPVKAAADRKVCGMCQSRMSGRGTPTMIPKAARRG